jgi:GTPase
MALVSANAYMPIDEHGDSEEATAGPTTGLVLAREFRARIKLLHHPKHLAAGAQVVLYIGTVQQVCTVSCHGTRYTTFGRRDDGR